MATKGHDSAFAWISGVGNIHPGLTKREYFAAMAMQGVLSNQILTTTYAAVSRGEESPFGEVVAVAALEYADALIDALNQENQ